MPTTTDPAALAYQTLSRSLKDHPVLRGHVRTWRVRDGSVKADEPVVASQCPWVRLTPISQPAEPFTRRSLAVPLEVAIETAVGSPDFPALAALWGRFLVALFSQDDADSLRLRANLESTGVSGIRLVKPALPDRIESYVEGPLVGIGSIILDIYLRTR